MKIDTHNIISQQVNGKFLWGAPSKTIYDLQNIDIFKNLTNLPFLVATGDDYVTIQGHVFKYVGEIEDYRIDNNLLI